jgi:hypothetical protein
MEKLTVKKSPKDYMSLVQSFYKTEGSISKAMAKASKAWGQLKVGKPKI